MQADRIAGFCYGRLTSLAGVHMDHTHGPPPPCRRRQQCSTALLGKQAVIARCRCHHPKHSRSRKDAPQDEERRLACQRDAVPVLKPGLWHRQPTHSDVPPLFPAPSGCSRSTRWACSPWTRTQRAPGSRPGTPTGRWSCIRASQCGCACTSAPTCLCAAGGWGSACLCCRADKAAMLS